MDKAQKKELHAQLLHWQMAIQRLTEFEQLASGESWSQLERETNSILRAALRRSIRSLVQSAERVESAMAYEDPQTIAKRILAVRNDYFRTETMLEFFIDAIRSRASGATGNILRGLDRIADAALRTILQPLGHRVPGVIVYRDAGIGASILKAGLRLWDRRSISPVASIKVVNHNICTPTSVLHECGHQVAYSASWNQQVRAALSQRLPPSIARAWSAWGSEIAADAVAFCLAGHGSLAALKNVVDGGPAMVFRYLPGDPHPIGMVRVLMVSAFAKHTMQNSGSEPWLELEHAWLRKYPLSAAPPDVATLIGGSLPHLGQVANIVLTTRFAAFGGRRLVDIADPSRVSPAALEAFEKQIGPEGYRSHYVTHRDSLRVLALNGYRIATDPEVAREYYRKQCIALETLGEHAKAA